MKTRILFSLVLLVGCGGAYGRSAEAVKLPADGAPPRAETSEAAPAALPVAEISQRDLDKVIGEAEAPACDTRPTPTKVDEPKLMAAKAVVDEWLNFKRTNPQAPRHGIKSNGTQDPTLVVTSLHMSCGGGRNSLEVNGREYPFDIAWVLSGNGASLTDGIEDSGKFAMIQALSLHDKRMVLVKVFVPSDAARETDDAVVVADLDKFVPEGAAPVVHTIGDKDKPQLETFVAPRGAKEGFYTVAPKQSDRTRARWLGVGRFKVGD
ncbi:MAG: hypothetical protein JST00_03100 [Deltaproteobacteria bacterium]|nr:hypothetical protein [Deltaproteobacteria bacterium]